MTLFAEELGPVGWTAVAGSVVTAVLAAVTTVYNLRRTAKKDDAELGQRAEDRVLLQQRELYDRAKKQCDEDKAELNLRIDLQDKRIGRLEETNAKLRDLYLQEVARRRYAEGTLKQHKIDLESWDGSTANLPAMDLAGPPPPPKPPEGK